MSGAQHTPGPWLAHGFDDDGCEPPTRHVWVSSAAADGTGRNVCQVVDHAVDGPADVINTSPISVRQLEADARLIAAAPDLFAACELGATYVRALHEALLAGNGRLRPEGGGVATGRALDDAQDAWFFASEAAIAKARGGA